MSEALEIFAARALREEGRRREAFNDATGKLVTCKTMTPAGNLSIGIGINLEAGLDDVEIEFLLRHRAQLVEARLQAFPWFTPLNAARQSVVIDIGFNDGVDGLLHFHRMITALDVSDWASARAECKVTNTELAGRYQALGNILYTGNIA